jgi:adenylyl-sulfate kinase
VSISQEGTGQRGEYPWRVPNVVLWLIGLSGAGKSTLADALRDRLVACGVAAVRLDGDDLRAGLNEDLGFSLEDRSENLRRAAHVAKILSGVAPVVLCSFITPGREDRAKVRAILGEAYVEVYIRTSLEECERRDPKGLYRRARAGQIRDFTGIGSAFDIPEAPDLVLKTETQSIDECVEVLLAYLRQR